MFYLLYCLALFINLCNSAPAAGPEYHKICYNDIPGLCVATSRSVDGRLWFYLKDWNHLQHVKGKFAASAASGGIQFEHWNPTFESILNTLQVRTETRSAEADAREASKTAEDAGWDALTSGAACTGAVAACFKSYAQVVANPIIGLALWTAGPCNGGVTIFCVDAARKFDRWMDKRKEWKEAEKKAAEEQKKEGASLGGNGAAAETEALQGGGGVVIPEGVPVINGPLPEGRVEIIDVGCARRRRWIPEDCRRK